LGFVPEADTLTTRRFSDSTGIYRYLETGFDGNLGASLTLPSGALVVSAELDGCDSTGLGDLWLSIHRNPKGPTPGLTEVLFGMTSGSPGCQSFLFTPSQPFTIDNAGNSYLVEVKLVVSPSASARFKAVRIYYQLQISPAPATASFADVPIDYWAFRHIEALAASGITAGCGGGAFCPEEPLTRAQMAVFLAKALGLHWAP